MTPRFTLAEFTHSDTAGRFGIDNTPTKEHLANWTKVTLPGFERARAIIGRPMVITSGYRNPAVNAAVGGVPNSDHALFLAGDFRVPGMPPAYAAQLLAASDLQFDQLIYEASRKVVHLGFGKRMRRQVLTQAGGPGTAVVPGIHS